MSLNEIIEWKDATKEQPDDGIVVLVKTPSPGEPVWLAYRDDGQWFTPENMGYAYQITHWADIPAGPKL